MLVINKLVQIEYLHHYCSSPARKFDKFDLIYASRLCFGLALRYTPILAREA
jgi:hypothetical protein